MNPILLLVIMSGICGGSVYPLIKIAENYNIPKFAYIFWESLIIIFLITVISLIRQNRTFFKLTEIKYYIFCALTNIIIPQTLSFMLAPNLSASIIGVVIVLTPLVVYLSMIIFFNETMIRHKTAGVIIGFVGAVLLFLPELNITNYEIKWYWLAFSFLLPIDYAINRIFVTKLLPQKSAPYSLIIGLFTVAAIISGFLMVFSQQIYIPFSSPTYGDMALLGHAILMTIFYMLFFVIAKSGSIQNALSFYVSPIIGMSWGILLFNEQIGFLFIISTLLVFSGLHLVNKK